MKRSLARGIMAACPTFLAASLALAQAPVQAQAPQAPAPQAPVAQAPQAPAPQAPVAQAPQAPAPQAPVAQAPQAPAPQSAAAPAAPFPSQASTPSAAESQLSAAAKAAERLAVRDPFRAPIRQMANATPKSELESFGLDQFSIVAVSTGPNRPGAMISAGGKTFLVQERVKIGPRGGHIRRITPDAIIVRERIVNPFGQEEDIDTPIRFAPDKKSGIVTQGPVFEGR